MKSLRPVILGSTLLLLGALALPAQERYGGYGDSGRYGRGSPDAVDRVLRDLDRVSLSYRAQRARESLIVFQNRLRREGRFDRDRLDRAINDLSHLASSRDIRPRERQFLHEDINLLRQLRVRADSRGGPPYPYRR